MWTIKSKKVSFLAALLALLAFPLTDLRAHEIVGEVTPLMIHMKRALLLIENGKDHQAVQEIRTVYEDFSHNMGMGMVMEGVGLKNTVRDIDARNRTALEPALSKAMEEGDAQTLKRIIQSVAYLLMLEKFDALQATFGNINLGLDSQKTIFWLGRNYFSYLLEPSLAVSDPIEEKRIERLLNRMFYRLEDGQPEEFMALRKELEIGITTALRVDLITLLHARSRAD